MRSLTSRAAVVAGAAVVLLGPAVGVASAAGGAAAGRHQAAGPDGSSGTWGNAKEVPGLAALNTGSQASISSVSCSSADNCSAGGSYIGNSSGQQAFVVSQVNGTWRKAMKVPGLAALNTGGGASVNSVSCASAGTCSAGGSYSGSSGGQAFVVSQVHGTWRQAKVVPGLAALNTGGGASIKSVSCASAGNCSAGGIYTDKSSGHFQAFVVSQVQGSWGKAKEVPGTAALNHDFAAITSLSCASAGNCSAGGYYTDSSGFSQVFVVSQVRGSWGKAKEVPGTAALNQSNASLNSMSCAPAGNCSAGGSYSDSSGGQQAFVVSQT